jgi:CRP-like cAMP-binding protein
MQPLNESPYTIINQMLKDIEDTGFKFDDEQIELFKLIKDIKRIKYKKGTIIYNSGDKVNLISLIARGFLKVYQDMNDKRVFLRMAVPADFIGLAAFSDSRVSPFTISVIEDAVLYHIPKEGFNDNIYKNPKLMKWLTNYLITQTTNAYKRSENINCKNMYARVADTLLYFSDIIFKSDSFYLPITKKQLGHYANV